MLELLPWVLIHVADRDYPIKKVCRILNFWLTDEHVGSFTRMKTANSDDHSWAATRNLAPKSVDEYIASS